MVNPPIFSGQCLTKHGAPCKFPFIFEGNTYNQCTDYKFGFFWCATEVDITLEMVDNQIGICKDSCPRGDILRGIYLEGHPSLARRPYILGPPFAFL